MKSQLTKPISKRRAMVVVAALAGASLLGWGSWELYGKFTGRPPTTAQVKHSIWKFLAKQTGDGDFKPTLDLSTASLSNTITFTNKNGRVKSVSKISKSGKL